MVTNNNKNYYCLIFLYLELWILLTVKIEPGVCKIKLSQ